MKGDSCYVVVGRCLPVNHVMVCNMKRKSKQVIRRETPRQMEKTLQLYRLKIRLDFLHSEYLQHAWTSLPTGTIHLLWLYSARHLKQVLQSSVINTDHRPNPKTFIIISEKRLSCDRHSWPGRSRAGALTILGQRHPVPPKPELGVHLSHWEEPARLAAGAARGNPALYRNFRCLLR